MENNQFTLEMVRNKICDWVEMQIEAFKYATVCPIYSENNSKLECIGSCVFIEYGNEKYLVTAAHVMNYKNNLFVCSHKPQDTSTGNQILLPLYDVEYFTQIYTGTPDSIDDDFSIFRLNKYLDIFEANIIDNTDIILLNSENNNNYHGVALGFPANKNQEKHTFRQKGKYLVFHGGINTPESQKFKNELNINNLEKNLILHLGSCTYTNNGNGNIGNLEGMSGGALFTFSEDCVFENFQQSENNKPCKQYAKLSGIIIEHHKLKGGEHYILNISIENILGKLPQPS